LTEPATARIDEIIPEEYDLVVLGSGEGAKFVARTLAKEGQRVAVVERKWIGGSCPNIACLPSKNIIHSAKVASYFKRASEFGGEIMSAVQIAMIAGLPYRALRHAILAHPTLAEGLVVLFSSAPVSVAHDAQEKP
jgi:pyruvate/2-oxoglutarate dehydrogenase complex dihydrolipoamide dehydrogenase (E3) component